ncbi:transcriptional regulator [Oxalicibacterium flavum]|uniref:Transcriptional regulator n=1 Tax=Oxalicibacterium flavum TaxID=179467 RepID=A0A8J2UPN9_9BURK|nr:transcriptional repressor [Oxalicibacterium flavum]GGC06602.1 transcriptional regulator [Oxalicibacterium flavum]
MKKNAHDYPALAEGQLRNSALRTTDARIKVLAALLGARHALSHQDVQDMLPGMDRVTLYRALDGLTDAGLAHKISGDDRVFRYSAGLEEAEAGDGHAHQHQHGHFKCTRCARVFCIENVDEKLFTTDMDARKAGSAATLRQQLQKILHSTLGKGFQSHDIELTIKGLCADCAAQSR